MAQTSSYEIANDSGAVVRGRLNEVFAAVQSSNSGASAPTNTAPGMLWLDTSVTPAVLRRRNTANTAWLPIDEAVPDPQDDTDTNAYLWSVGDVQTAASVIVPPLTEPQVTDPDSEDFGTVSGQRLAQVRDAYQIGWDQTWQDVSASRTFNTSYQNTTGKPIMVATAITNNSTVNPRAMRVSPDNTTWVALNSFATGGSNDLSFIVPDGWYYEARTSGGSPTIVEWAELR